MTQEIEEYIVKFPEDIVRLFMKIRDVVFSIEDISVEEKMWAKLPSYYYGEKFVRIIPFKDHINIEAEGFAKHTNEFEGCKFTPKGMLQIKANSLIDFEKFKIVVIETFI